METTILAQSWKDETTVYITVRAAFRGGNEDTVLLNINGIELEIKTEDLLRTAQAFWVTQRKDPGGKI